MSSSEATLRSFFLGTTCTRREEEIKITGGAHLGWRGRVGQKGKWHLRGLMEQG
jgi:hypothetical protein